MADPGPPNPPFSEDMAAGLAHEVRNQLNALQLHVQILEQELGERPSEAGSGALDRLHRMTRALDELDDFLSEFLRLAHPPPVVPETIALAPLLRELVTFLGARVRRPRCRARDGPRPRSGRRRGRTRRSSSARS